jgi:NADH-quinone oxidoreductase subunit M
VRGVYEMSFWWALSCGIGIALGAAYLLWLFQRTMLGEISEKNKPLLDLNWREVVVFAPLVVLAFAIGVHPQPWFKVMDRSVAQIVERVRPGYYEQRGLVNPLAASPLNARAPLSVQPATK